ncbi:MAG: cytochrome c [Acidobacteria bacterium]|nr:MAG: cytochrome c [Acidobacteriota bacterium]
MTNIFDRRLLAIAVAALALTALTSCLRGCNSRQPPIHLNPNMDSQPFYEPQAESRFFASGSTSQAPVPGTIARGELRDDDTFYSGRNFFGYVSNPQSNEGVVARGKDRFNIYCTPCHGTAGDGQGKLYERSGIKSANLHDERIRDMADGRIFSVITNGQGLMQGYIGSPFRPAIAGPSWPIYGSCKTHETRSLARAPGRSCGARPHLCSARAHASVPLSLVGA